ncbi:hypothetical protein E2C01_086291 [Portunus trituberculatus]|uniref:Uncharacterized protein n=1 Tax=Portunus trituberculatus TaxID=210409 RepID=A0A5B7JD21_PORTR|nr:hypothetical protein [Portunus trituberculatus]
MFILLYRTWEGLRVDSLVTNVEKTSLCQDSRYQEATPHTAMWTKRRYVLLARDPSRHTPTLPYVHLATRYPNDNLFPCSFRHISPSPRTHLATSKHRSVPASFHTLTATRSHHPMPPSP